MEIFSAESNKMAKYLNVCLETFIEKSHLWHHNVQIHYIDLVSKLETLTQPWD